MKRIERALFVWRTGVLDALALWYGTDKSSAGHNYTPLYSRYFSRRRRAVRSVLEIGVGGVTSLNGYETTAGGQSLRMWARYFPNARVVGIDIFPKLVTGPRIHFEQGSQSDPQFLTRIVDQYGPFDIVIDDGSHIGRDIVASFAVLWKAVRPQGFYVIEDLDLAYHADWEGGPPGTPGTAVELLKGMIDNTVAHCGEAFAPTANTLHVYREIAFLQRAQA